MLAGCFAAPTYEGEAMDNFNGKVFVNRDPMDKGLFDMQDVLGFNWYFWQVAGENLTKRLFL